MKKKHKKPYKSGSPKAKEAIKKHEESLSRADLFWRLIPTTPPTEKGGEE